MPVKASAPLPVLLCRARMRSTANNVHLPPPPPHPRHRPHPLESPRCVATTPRRLVEVPKQALIVQTLVVPWHAMRIDVEQSSV